MPLRRQRELAWQQIGDELVVMNLAGQRVLGLNRTAALLFSLVEEKDEDGLVRVLVERFATDEASAREDVRGFLAVLKQRGLVSEA